MWSSRIGGNKDNCFIVYGVSSLVDVFQDVTMYKRVKIIKVWYV